MNLEETAKLLTVIAAYDNRNVTRETVVVWQQALGHLSLNVAQQAVVLHFKESTEYLKPGHVHAASKRVQDAHERSARVTAQKAAALEPAAITLDREAHETETAYWIRYYREHPDER
jgi:hypothetical protein